MPDDPLACRWHTTLDQADSSFASAGGISHSHPLYGGVTFTPVHEKLEHRSWSRASAQSRSDLSRQIPPYLGGLVDTTLNTSLTLRVCADPDQVIQYLHPRPQWLSLIKSQCN